MRECSPPQSCHVSHVTCHVSHVTCHMSRVTCHMSHVTCHFSFLFGQSGEAYRWRVCYQRGLPRLVLTTKGIIHDLVLPHRFCLMVELHREGSEPAACAAGLFTSKDLHTGPKNGPCPPEGRRTLGTPQGAPW